MTEALRRTRAGHRYNYLCRKQNEADLGKRSIVTYNSRVSYITMQFNKMQGTTNKTRNVDQQINEAMTAAEVEEDAFQEERNPVDENDLKICTIIDALQFVIDAAATRPETTEDAAEPTAPPAPEYSHAPIGPKKPTTKSRTVLRQRIQRYSGRSSTRTITILRKQEISSINLKELITNTTHHSSFS